MIRSLALMSPLARHAPTLLVLLLASACSLAGGLTPGAAQSSESPSPSLKVLSNGVRVLVQEFEASEVVAIQLWVRTGGRDEASSELGLAHYLEHMLFKGTALRAPGFVEREVEGVGGGINAGTSLDYTYYHTVRPARRAVAGIEMLADISVNSTLDPTALDLEKRVVLEEMRLTEDNPRRLMFRQIYEVLFAGHPYGRPVIGTPELVRGLTRDTLMAFYRRHYVPDAFVLVVVGPVKTADVLTVAERTLGRLPRGGGRRLGGGPAHAGQSAPRRGRGPRGDPKAPGAGGLSGGAQARRDSGGGGQCVLRRDRRGTGAHVRPRRNGVATPGGARVRGSSPLGYARADPGGGAPLPRSRALRPPGLRPAGEMSDARLSQATHGSRRPRGPRHKMSDARLSQATHGARRPRGPRYK